MIMYLWHLFILILVLSAVKCAVIANDEDVDEQGLYSKSDHVVILTQRNFEKKIYHQPHAAVVQFYNSYCGHCRSFAPKFKALAAEVIPWKNILQLKVIDCSVEENNELCREFEIMAYPSVRYIHENYVKANGNVGERIPMTDTAEKLKAQLILKMQSEQSMGRLIFAPKLSIASYLSYAEALEDVPNNVIYTFLVFENENSTVGSELALDINDYKNIRVKRVHDVSELASVAGLRRYPSLVAVSSTLVPIPLTPDEPNRQNLLKAINLFLKSKDYVFPIRGLPVQDSIHENTNEKIATSSSDVVYYSDLEKTLKTSLHTEITRHKTLSGEPLMALLDYLNILKTLFPYKNYNLKEYIEDLYDTLHTRNEWNGNDIYEIVKRLEIVHAPVYMSQLEYVGCKGSQAKYRGYTCGLWTLFHTLTVSASQKQGAEGPNVLKAMHGYVKHFFGCTTCSEHFQAMAAQNRLFDVKENDKAVLWLWISHNEVNLRLAGDVTEDPEHPKIQFPLVTRCPECRLARGAWNLPAVYQYLQNMYGSGNIRDARRARSAGTATSPFSNMDIGMLSLLYILSFIILILVIKYFLTKRLYRKRHYKHVRSKV